MLKKLNPMYICIDFDGTIVTHEYPEIGDPVPNALSVLRKLRQAGHKLILFTMRSEDKVDEAVNYLRANGIMLHGVNHNPDQDSWTTSPKAYGQLYIDDAALGTKLIYDDDYSRPYVDWKWVEVQLTKQSIL